MKHKNLVLTAIMAAVLCVISPFSLPLGTIPLSFATLAVFLVSCISPPKRSVASVIVYILLGASGLPVFSGFVGGFQQIAGLTGGYIIGYIPCSFAVSYLTTKSEKSKFIYPLSMALGIAVCYFCGTVWYSYQTDTDFSAALAVCVLPFIAGDIIKIIAASAIGITLKNRLKKYI